jgi:hypothetical protein
MRFGLYGGTQSEPKQGVCFDCIDARGRNQARRLLQEGFEQVLHRPIETTRDYWNAAPPYENLLDSVPTYSGKIGNREEYLR